jgi:hypothetical protein
MTTEEKARKYDEALEIARKCLDEKRDTCFVRPDVIFPELAESENEKIRKGIIELVKQSSEILDKKNQEQMLDWLEKQGEQKPKWSEEDEKNWCGIIDEIEANKSNAPDYDIKTYDRFLSWLNNIKQRMEGIDRKVRP